MTEERTGVPAGMTEAEWLEARRTGIGGSDAAAVVGVSKWGSPLEVYLDKLGLREPKERSEAMYWGIVLEPIVVDEYEKRTGRPVFRSPSFLRHPDHGFMVASLDGTVRDPDLGTGGFEAKTAGAHASKEWAEGEIPDDYYFQVQHYMAVTGLPFFDVAVLLAGQKYMDRRIFRDDRVIAMLIEAEGRFWTEHVLKEVPPLPTGSEADADALKVLYPGGDADEVLLDADIEELLKQRALVKEQVKVGEDRIREIDNRLKAAMGNHEVGRAGHYLVKYPAFDVKRIDSARLREERPDLAEEYSTSTPQRRLTVSEKG